LFWFSPDISVGVNSTARLRGCRICQEDAVVAHPGRGSGLPGGAKNSWADPPPDAVRTAGIQGSVSCQQRRGNGRRWSSTATYAYYWCKQASAACRTNGRMDAFLDLGDHRVSSD